MTAVPVRATGAPIPLPTPAALADALTRHQDRPALATVTATPAAMPHKRRLPSEPAPGETPAATRDRLRWIDCNAGRHTWAGLPEHLGADVCRHCPERADQADRIREARRARATGATR